MRETVQRQRKISTAQTRLRKNRAGASVLTAIPKAAPDGISSGKLVGSVVGAITILRYLAAANEPVGVSRIARETGQNPSTTFNILRTLLLYDFVQFDQLSKTYLLSL